MARRHPADVWHWSLPVSGEGARPRPWPPGRLRSHPPHGEPPEVGFVFSLTLPNLALYRLPRALRTVDSVAAAPAVWPGARVPPRVPLTLASSPGPRLEAASALGGPGPAGRSALGLSVPARGLETWGQVQERPTPAQGLCVLVCKVGRRGLDRAPPG